MGLKETSNQLKRLMEDILHDLNKANLGNKTASQRVRTNSIKFSKLAKVYRKESLTHEKGVKGKLKKAPPKKTTSKKPLKAAKKTR